MKKKILIFIILVCVLLVGCNSGEKKELEEIDIAKVLLANERLDSEELRTKGNLFTSGKQAFSMIQEASRKYSQRMRNKDIRSKLNINGNRYTWTDAPNYSNFISYFDSYATSIEFNAEKGSDLIDLTKSTIQTVDTWIKIDSQEQLLLSVDKNSETIISRSDDQYEICRRYLNSLGQNTFEMFIANSDTNSKSRMTYIPGLRYEYTSIQNDHMLVIIASKDKGYWDIMSTSYHPEYDANGMTFTNLVMKEEAIYETTYTISNDNGVINDMYGEIKLISSDGKSDLLSFYNNSVSIFTTGLQNLNCFYIDAQNNEVEDVDKVNNREDYKLLYTGTGEDRRYFTDQYSDVIAKFDNGKEMAKGNILCDGNVEVYGTMIYPIGDVDFYGEIKLDFKENNLQFIFDNMEKLMDEYGFTFKDDFTSIKSAMTYSLQDSLDFSKYYLWQENHINSFEDIKKAIKIEEDLIDEFVNVYNSYKDADIIKNEKQMNIDDSYHFSNLNVLSYGNVNNEGNKITIQDLVIKVEDCSLFTNNKNYQIAFAFANEKDGVFSNLFNLDFANPIIKLFEGNVIDTPTNDSMNFELNQSAILEVPLLETGEYVLVAYIATADEGIRVTNPVSLKGSIIENEINQEGFINVLHNGEDNIIVIESNQTALINISLTESYSYSELYLLLESYAYKYGRPTTSELETENNSSWENIANNTPISSGTYRLKYYNSYFDQESYIIATVK